MDDLNRIDRIMHLIINPNDAFVNDRSYDILEMDFPSLKVLMGSEQFEILCRRYLQKYPAKDQSSRQLSAELSHFIEMTKPYCYNRQLAEMAAFEWGLVAAEEAEEADTISSEQFSELPEAELENLTFTFHPSFSLVIADHNIATVWESCETTTCQERLERLPTSITFAIWRRNKDVNFLRFRDNTGIVLQMIVAQTPYAEICKQLAETMPKAEVAPFVQKLMLDMLDAGMVTKLNTQ